MTAVLIILAVLILLFALSLIIPIDLIITAGTEDGFDFAVRIFGKTFKGDGEKKENNFADKILKRLGLKKSEKANDKKKNKRGIEDLLSLLKSIVSEVLFIIKKCRLICCRITSINGGEDAAINYGIACAAVYPTVAYLENVMKTKKNTFRLDIRCDYEREESQHEIYAIIRFKIFNILSAALRFARKNLMR